MVWYGLYGLKHHIVEISGDVTDAGRTNKRTNKRTTSKDRANQLLICELLSFAINMLQKLEDVLVEKMLNTAGYC